MPDAEFIVGALIAFEQSTRLVARFYEAEEEGE